MHTFLVVRKARQEGYRAVCAALVSQRPVHRKGRKKQSLRHHSIMTHVFVTGTRGIPDVPGGIETHCRDLYPLIAEKGYQVTVAGRKSYLTFGRTRWKGVDILPVWTVSGQYGEAIVHTFLSILQAWMLKADLVHIHAVGPGLLVPLAKCLGLKVVFTSHCPESENHRYRVYHRAKTQPDLFPCRAVRAALLA